MGYHDFLSDEERQECTQQMLAAAGENRAEFDALAGLAVRTLKLPASLICLDDEQGPDYVGTSHLNGWEGRPCCGSLCGALCREAIRQGGRLVIDDARDHPLAKNARAKGDLPVAAFVGMPLRLSSGQVVGSFSVIDIRPRAWTEEELDLVAHFAGVAANSLNVRYERQLLGRLEEHMHQVEKMSALGRFAGGIVHDFNNMLTAVVGCAELAQAKAETPEQVRRHVGDIVSIVDRGSGLTAQLLAFCRQEQVAAVAVHLDKVVKSLRPMLRGLMPEGIKLRFQFHCKRGVVLIDPGQLGQVVLNLVVNARDAIGEGGRIQVSTSRRELEKPVIKRGVRLNRGAYAVITVADDGSGISREHLSSIFDPFFTTKGKGKGTGLGLSTVFGIVKRAGGAIGIRTTPGEGTLFRIWLPLIPAPAKEPEPVSVAGNGHAAPLLEPRLVLVVDDDPAVREVLCLSLRAKGLSVLEAADGHEAVIRAAGCPGAIDLLLTDIHLPGLDGIQAAEQILVHRPELAIIFMSGDAHDRPVSAIPRENLVAVIQKPFRIRELLDLWQGVPV